MKTQLWIQNIAFFLNLFLLPSRKASSNTHYDRTVTPCWDPVHFYMMLFLRGCSEHGRASNCHSYYIFDNARKMLGLSAVEYNRKRFAYVVYLKTRDTFHCRALARVKFSERGKFFFMPLGYVRFDSIKAIKILSHFTGKAVFSLQFSTLLFP